MFQRLFLLLSFAPVSTFLVFAEPVPPEFAISTIEMGDVRGQTVLTGFLNTTERASLVLLTVDRDGGRKVRLYEMDEQSFHAPTAAEYALSDDVILADVGYLLDRDVVVFFTRDAVWKFNPLTGNRTQLI